MFNHSCFWLHRSVATNVLYPTPRAERQNSMASTNVKLVDRGAEGGNAFVRSVEQNARAREVDRDHAGERPVARSKLDE